MIAEGLFFSLKYPIDALMRRWRPVEFKSSFPIVYQGHFLNAALVLEIGSVSLHENEKIVGEIGPLHCIGFPHLAMNTQSCLTAIVEEGSRAILFDKTTLLLLLNEESSFGDWIRSEIISKGRTLDA